MNIYIISILCFVTLTVRAQYDVSFSHYWAMEPSFNPAAVGKESKLNIAGAYAIQMAGYEHNPNTMYAAADMPFYALKSYHGSETFDGSKADVIDDDPVFTKSSSNGSAFDIGLGLYYRRCDWYAGFSVLHVTSPRVDLGEKNQLDIAATYYLTGGYNIQLRNPFLSIQTSVLGRTDGVAWRGDISGRLQYSHEKRRFYAGLTYSPTTSVTFQLGGVIKGVKLGYSYELYTSALGAGNGSHELFVGYQMDIDLRKKGRNLHKSVRIL